MHIEKYSENGGPFCFYYGPLDVCMFIFNNQNKRPFLDTRFFKKQMFPIKRKTYFKSFLLGHFPPIFPIGPFCKFCPYYAEILVFFSY